MSRLDLQHFTEQIIRLWDELDKKKLMSDIETSLTNQTIPIADWPDSVCENRPGIYCFWYTGKSMDFDSFNTAYNFGHKGYSLSKTYINLYRDGEGTTVDLNGRQRARALYLGKRTVVLSRISQHIGNPPKSQKTYGMHLNRLKKDKHQLYNTIRVGYWLLPQEVNDKLKKAKHGKYIIQQLLVYIETEMRKNLKPMIGKQ